MNVSSGNLVVVVALLAMAGCECNDEPPAPPPPPPPTSELHGLRSSVARLERAGTMPAVEVTYVLEWVAPMKAEVDPAGNIRVSNAWLLELVEPAVVSFWDGSGALVGETVERFGLPDEFRDRSVPRREVRFSVNPPASAKTLSIALGRSGLETGRAALP